MAKFPLKKYGYLVYKIVVHKFVYFRFLSVPDSSVKESKSPRNLQKGYNLEKYCFLYAKWDVHHIASELAKLHELTGAEFSRQEAFDKSTSYA